MMMKFVHDRHHFLLEGRVFSGIHVADDEIATSSW